MYTNLYDYLEVRGLKPTFNIMDNEASTGLKRYMTTRYMKYQLVEPHCHRANLAERAIQTFKNHLIAILCSTNKDFPIHLWDHLLPQVVLTLNILRSSRINPRLSAEAQLNGDFDFNKTHLAPPGTKSIVYEDADTRGSWYPHGEEFIYIRHAGEHYVCYKFW